MRPRKSSRHLPACVYQKHGAYYYVKAGKWTRLAKDLPSALQAYAKLIEGSSKGAGMIELIDKVLAHIEPTLKPNTIAQYRIAAGKLKPILLEFSPEQVLPRHIAGIKMHFASTPNMANRLLSFLRTVFSYALEWALVDSNPCIGVRRHKEAKRDRYIKDDEFMAIRAAAKHKAIPIVMDLCYLTGQRIGDVLAIRNEDISDAGICFTQEKTGARLMVSMTTALSDTILKARESHPVHSRASTLLYTRGFKPYSYSTIKDAFNRAREAVGLGDVTIHDIRAKSGTDADHEGKDPQRLLGHSNPQMTKRYLRGREVKVVEGPVMVKKVG